MNTLITGILLHVETFNFTKRNYHSFKINFSSHTDYEFIKSSPSDPLGTKKKNVDQRLRLVRTAAWDLAISLVKGCWQYDWSVVVILPIFWEFNFVKFRSINYRVSSLVEDASNPEVLRNIREAFVSATNFTIGNYFVIDASAYNRHQLVIGWRSFLKGLDKLLKTCGFKSSRQLWWLHWEKLSSLYSISNVSLSMGCEWSWATSGYS